MDLAAIANLISVAGPQIVSLVVQLKGKDGTVTTVQYLDSAEADFEANNKQIADWLAANPPA